MRKFMVISIPIATLILFILIMLSGNYLKKPFGKNDNVPGTIEEITQLVKNEKWDEVSVKTDKLENSWKIVINRIQFSAERDEINSLSMNIARLRGATMAKDKPSALIELREAYEHWKDIGK